MNVLIKNIVLIAAGAASVGGMAVTGAGPAAACDINSATDISCGPISVNPANPLSPLNPSNPSSPSSPLNPANPASPLNLSNPANPASPLNPANQWANNPANPANPLSPYNAANSNYGYGYGYGYGDGYGYGYGDGYGANGLGVLGLLSGILGADQPAPAAEPGDVYAPEQAPVVHHRHHRRHRPAQ